MLTGGSFVGHEPQLLIWGSSQFPKGYRLPMALFGRNSGGPTQDEALPCPGAGREVGCGRANRAQVGLIP